MEEGKDIRLEQSCVLELPWDLRLIAVLGRYLPS